ncbi:hypothetical protein KP509_23G015100 [Ceratopteris richardii]|uniref:Retrotransposon gag domain-containing protein n=1 Tax=Ceratopteris richardii TaxID=49495 RepID=A0A8T2S0K3_CERRI|nr:hypothetical protein KP509_23G015100 [Ceratopteris richardii]
MSEGSSSLGETRTEREERAQRRSLERERHRWESRSDLTSTSGKKPAKKVYSRRRVANQVQKFEGGILRPCALNFWDHEDIDITPLFEMAQRVHDPDSFIQLFEVTCEANEVVDQAQRLRIFPAIFRDEAANWYENLEGPRRRTDQMLKDAFLAKFRRQGFQDRLAQQMDYLRQGVNESIDHYIQRMETLVRKMGANAPNEDTLKRRFIAGLRDPSAQQHISLSQPATLVAAKDVARVWEEVQLGQQRRQELLFEPMQGTDTRLTSGATQANIVVTPPAFMATTNTPQEVKPTLMEERIIEIVAQAVKDATLTHETYAVRQKVVLKPNQGVFRSNIFCAKCQGYGHMVT